MALDGFIKQGVVLYSSKLEPAIRDKALAIRAQHGDSFATKIFINVGDCYSPSAPGWREAKKDQNTETWSVYDWAFVQDVASNQTAEQRTTILRGVCYLDALAACVEFENLARDSGQIEKGPDAGQSASPHYTDFADREGTLLDMRNGMPVPVADGEILVDGRFKSGAAQIAQASKGNLARQNSLLPQVDNFGFMSESLPVPVSGMSAENALMQHRMIDSTRNSLDRLENSFKMASKNKFLPMTSDMKGALFAGGFTTGFTTVAASLFGLSIQAQSTLATELYALGGTLFVIGTFFSGLFFCMRFFDEDAYFPGRNFKKEMNKFYKSIERIPDGDNKKALKLLADEINLGYHVLWSRQAFKDAADSQKSGMFANLRFKKATRAFRKVAIQNNLIASEIQYLEQQISQPPGLNDFEKDLKGKLQDRIYKFQDALETLSKCPLTAAAALPTPQ